MHVEPGGAEMHNDDMARTAQQAALDYLRHVLNQLKMSPTALAKLAGLASTTLTRALNSEDHKFTLSTTTLDRIRSVTGYDYAPFLSQDMDTLARTIDMFNRSAYDLASTEPHGSLEDTRGIVVIGEVAAGVWREVQFQSDDILSVLFLVPSRPEQRKGTIGLIVRGESLNRIARDGDVLVVETIATTGARPRDGDLVIAERRRDQDGIIEVTAKRLKGGQLVPESDDPRFQSPLLIGEHANETVAIIGIVHYIVRQP